jgi:hypothetical protein
LQFVGKIKNGSWVSISAYLPFVCFFFFSSFYTLISLVILLFWVAMSSCYVLVAYAWEKDTNLESGTENKSAHGRVREPSVVLVEKLTYIYFTSEGTILTTNSPGGGN